MVYVDQITSYPDESVAAPARKHGSRWCHLWADYGDQENLHQIAASIGLKREWFQKEGTYFPHYDLVPGKQLQAIQAGAQPRDLKDWMTENHDRIREFASKRGENVQNSWRDEKDPTIRIAKFLLYGYGEGKK